MTTIAPVTSSVSSVPVSLGIKPVLKQLANGVKLVFIDTETNDRVQVTHIFPVGNSSFKPELAHLFEHMIYSGALTQEEHIQLKPIIF